MESFHLSPLPQELFQCQLPSPHRSPWEPPQSWRRRMQRAISCEPGGQFLMRCLKGAGDTLDFGSLSHVQPGQGLAWVPLWCLLLLALCSPGRARCPGHCPGPAVAEENLRLRKSGIPLASAQLLLVEQHSSCARGATHRAGLRAALTDRVW